MASRFREVPPGERGFVLIAAIWLLVLAGSIVALLMLYAMTSAKRTRFEADQLSDDQALRSAIETVAADRAINGVRSRWWLVPAEGDLAIGDRVVHLRISSEAGRLDLNEADPSLIDDTLRGLGADAKARQSVTQLIAAFRSRKVRIGSFEQIRALAMASNLRLANDTCLDEIATFTSGLSQPRAGQMPPSLARLFPSETVPDPSTDSALRVEGRTLSGQGLRLTLRIRAGPSPIAIGSIDSPYECTSRS